MRWIIVVANVLVHEMAENTRAQSLRHVLHEDAEEESSQLVGETVEETNCCQVDSCSGDSGIDFLACGLRE